jgi:heparan-alpha-glucosaminide N-acetyltransferase
MFRQWKAFSVAMSMESSPAPRLASLDAYRGFIMILMASGGFGIPMVAKNLPDSIWPKIAPWFEHVPWSGGVLWDLIQPAFMFMVGVAAAYSCAKRLARGDSYFAVLRHAAVRALVLVLLSVLLASNGAKVNQTVWQFTNVLGQIGLGYFFLVLLSRAGWKTHLAAFFVIVTGYWLWFAVTPPTEMPPGANVAWLAPSDMFSGFFAHWNPHTNPAAEFDRWFLNLFPCAKPYVSGNGGYQTLNFVPSLATMILGLMTGNLLRGGRSPSQKLRDMLIAAAFCLALGFIAGQTVCPVVKRIWTPSWVLWSAGWVFLMLAFFYFVIDVKGRQKWALPLTVVGMNSILIYLGYQLSSGWIKDTLVKHLGHDLFSGPYQAMAERGGVLLVLWLVCAWLYRQRVFLKI